MTVLDVSSGPLDDPNEHAVALHRSDGLNHSGYHIAALHMTVDARKGLDVATCDGRMSAAASTQTAPFLNMDLN